MLNPICRWDFRGDYPEEVCKLFLHIDRSRVGFDNVFAVWPGGWSVSGRGNSSVALLLLVIDGKGKTMKKQSRKTSRHSISFGELVQTISSCSKNSRETVAAVTDLIESGVVRFESNGRKVRGHVRL